VDKIRKTQEETLLQYVHSLQSVAKLEGWSKRNYSSQGYDEYYSLGIDMNLIDNDQWDWKMYDACAICGTAGLNLPDKAQVKYLQAAHGMMLEGWHLMTEVVSRKRRGESLANLSSVTQFKYLRLLVNEDDNRLNCGGNDCQNYARFGECASHLA
jgi:hypothetical protein